MVTESEKPKQAEPQEQSEKPKIDFYKIKFDKEGQFSSILIKLVEFTETIKELGFCRFDLESGVTLFVHVKDKVVEQVEIIKIIDALLERVAQSEGCKYVSPKMITEKIYGNLARYFNPQLLQRIKPHEPFEFVEDTKDNAFVCFKNGVVVCDGKGYKLHPYSKFDRNIWKKQIINRDFQLSKDSVELLERKNCIQVGAGNRHLIEIAEGAKATYGNFAYFCYLIAGDVERFYSLCSLLGYVMHDYSDYKMRSVVLTDSVIGENGESNGRSGKTLLFKALNYIRNLTEINGKDFDATNKHKYDRCTLETQIVFINDLLRKFDPEDLFNDITEGITVDVKNQHPYNIQVKMVFTCNKPLKIEGHSARDRFIEFDIKDYFHIGHTPEMEFKQWFFRDWDKKEWNKFDNFMLFCISYFLKNGIVEPSYINLAKRKLIEFTALEFVSFFDEHISNSILPKLHEGVYRIEKGEFYNLFMSFTSDFGWLKKRTFTQWVRKYGELSEVYTEHLKPYSIEANELRSSGNDYFEFFPLENKSTQSA